MSNEALVTDLNTIAELKHADDRLYIFDGQPAYVAGRGWGLYRMWTGQDRTRTVEFVEDRLRNAGNVAVNGDAAVEQALRRALRGVEVLRCEIYRDDADVAARMARAQQDARAALAEIKRQQPQPQPPQQQRARPTPATSPSPPPTAHLQPYAVAAAASAMGGAMPTVRSTTRRGYGGYGKRKHHSSNHESAY